MSKASDDTLQLYITDHKKYKPEAVDAAIAELSKRGRPLSDLEIAAIRSAVQVVQEEQKRDLDYDTNETDNPDDPELYSPAALYTMSFFFGALFAAVLYSMNLARVNKTVWIIPVVVLSLGMSVFQMFALPALGGVGQILAGIVSLFFVYTLQGVLWKHITPADLKFRKRPVLYPAIIGSVLTIIIFILLLRQHR